MWKSKCRHYLFLFILAGILAMGMYYLYLLQDETLVTDGTLVNLISHRLQKVGLL